MELTQVRVSTARPTALGRALSVLIFLVATVIGLAILIPLAAVALAGLVVIGAFVLGSAAFLWVIGWVSRVLGFDRHGRRNVRVIDRSGPVV